MADADHGVVDVDIAVTFVIMLVASKLVLYSLEGLLHTRTSG